MKANPMAVVKAKTHRLIASRYPTIGVFDDIAVSPEDLRAAFLLEGLTNDRLSARRIMALPTDEIVSGPSATLVMASFLHASETGGRFTDGRLGAWYASLAVMTAIRETLHHAGARLAKSAGGFPNRIQVRELVANINCELVDLRGLQEKRPELYDPEDYAQSQRWAAELRWPKQPPPANGIVFDSVRDPQGTNVCVFWPSKVRLPVTQGQHYEYHWDAKGTPSVVKLAGVLI